MSSDIQKWQATEQSLTSDRERITSALARLGSEQVQMTQRDAHASKAAAKPGRLVFILDLTGSRRESLRRARIATASMLDEIKRIGSLAVKLIYYRGRKECQSSRWETDPEVISRTMRRLSCESGCTQIARALRCVLDQEEERVSAVVFIGDESEDEPDTLARLAAALGEKHVPIYVFHEIAAGTDGLPSVKAVFELMAEASGGHYSVFEPESAAQLRELLSTVAAFSTAGVEGVKQMEPARTEQGRQLRGRLLLGPGNAECGDKT
jgi:hypothetical protein